MQKQAKGASAPSDAPAGAPSFRASAAAQLGGGKTYDAAPVSFEGDRTLIAELNDADAAFPLRIVVAPAGTPGQIDLVNHTRWPVLFLITTLPDETDALGAVEVAPGGVNHVRPG